MSERELSAEQRQMITDRLVTTVDLFADTCDELMALEVETGEVFQGWPSYGDGWHTDDAAFVEATVGGEKFVVIAARRR